ncbi:hypothetical protein K2173_008517 [Erythroxylum novogranatense]|uniref:PAR1 protein n=1 Tax=Erythroxylum novogranatense TaxID=1862640 RepID=A0AAV8SKI4_9ROSI|nr:hypothetical protein K2173_008517 [Erythroxylum novogranatense]
MACNFIFKTLLLAAFVIALSVPGTLGEVTCEKLDKDTCAFAVSGSGKRCVLEKHVRRSGREAYICRTSEIEADRLKNWVETNECIRSCGLERESLGISSDSLLDTGFTRHLCSHQCYDSCPNVVDLYFNLAAGEGVFLPKLCEAQEGSARRELMAEIRSGGVVAPGPVHGVKYGVAPSIAPF